MSRGTYDAVLQRLQDDLRAGCQNLRCLEFVARLSALGFNVDRASGGNHYTYTHLGLSHFYGGHFNGGHGANPVMKPCYVRDAVQLIKQFEEELRGLEQ